MANLTTQKENDLQVKDLSEREKQFLDLIAKIIVNNISNK